MTRPAQKHAHLARLFRTGLAACSLAVLGACGNNVPVSDRLPGLAGAERAGILARAGAPVLQVGLVETGSSGVVVREARRGGVDSYVSPDGFTLSFRNGLLISAKGIDEVLMAADTVKSRALVESGRSGTSERFHSYLGGLEQTDVRAFRCIVAPQGPRSIRIGTGERQTMLMSEVCTSLTDPFENRYWIDPMSGTVLQSRQWIGPRTGALSTRIVPGGFASIVAGEGG